MLDLAIVIVNYNVCDLLRNCLKSVYASAGLRFEVCVVDNASPDASAGMVAREFPQAHLIRNQDNAGYAAANNLGLRLFGFGDQASVNQDRRSEIPRYALLLNPDTIVPPDAFAKMLQLLDQHTEVGIAGPKLVRLDGSLDLACRRSFPTPEVSFWRLTHLSKLFPHSRLFGRYNMTYLNPDQAAEVDAVVGAFMLVRREAIQQAGLLDERFWMYGEDLDWAYRIKQKGWRVYYYPQVVVQHVKRASSSQSTSGGSKAKYEFDRAMWLFYHKHYQTQTSAIVDWLVRLGLGLRGGSRLRAEMKSQS
jgi:N-acetylglucosaminyl-diphospho-decaprenol L-rhamnosyltransferase